MSKTLLTLLLAELQTVRLVCRYKDPQNQGKECGGIAEVPVDRLHALGKCSLCGTLFQREGDSHARFKDFADAARRLMEENGRVRVEFVLPVDDGGAVAKKK